MSPNRVVEFDMMKGIGIVSMILCHRLYELSSFYEWIHTFHMPLFVFISGYLYKERCFTQMVVHSAKRILLPFLLVCVVLIIFDADIRSHLYESIMFSNPPLWVVWFLPSLFIVQILAHITFGVKWLEYGSLLVSVLPLLLFDKLPLPLYLWQGVFMYPFFWVGHHIATHGYISKLKDSATSLFVGIIALVVWLSLFSLEPSSLRLSVCQANWFLFGDVLASGSACIFFFIVCRFTKQISWIINIFSWLGSMSMAILCLHAIDHLLLQGFPWIGAYWHYTFFLGELAFPIGYLTVELPLLVIITKVICKVKPLRYVFGIQ